MVFASKTANSGPELQVSKVPRPNLWFCVYKTVRLASELLVSMDPSPHLLFFCMQNSEFSTRITSLYCSQPSSVVFACKTANLGPELQVSMVPRPNLLFCVTKQRA